MKISPIDGAKLKKGWVRGSDGVLVEQLEDGSWRRSRDGKIIPKKAKKKTAAAAAKDTPAKAAASPKPGAPTPATEAEGSSPPLSSSEKCSSEGGWVGIAIGGAVAVGIVAGVWLLTRQRSQT